MPRTLVNRDTIFDEDELSKFTQQYPLEMYMENVEGYEGEGELFTRFGIEIRDQATFVLSKRRWEQMVDREEDAGGTFQLKARPAEGDLLFFPKTKSLFEIKMVEFQNPFYQLGKIYTFRLQCELFEYSSERLDTGDSDIDGIEDLQSLDILQFQFQLENGDLLKLEDNDTLILESFQTSRGNVGVDNEDFDSWQTASNILDFTEKNPFGEI